LPKAGIWEKDGGPVEDGGPVRDGNIPDSTATSKMPLPLTSMDFLSGTVMELK
jgi:hypothetical protein